jgi:hypothetical protein
VSTQLELPVDADLTWDDWFRNLPRSPVATLPDRRPLAPSRAAGTCAKAQGSTPPAGKIGPRYQPTTEEEAL